MLIMAGKNLATRDSVYAKQNSGMKTVTDTHCKPSLCIRTFPYHEIKVECCIVDFKESCWLLFPQFFFFGTCALNHY